MAEAKKVMAMNAIPVVALGEEDTNEIAEIIEQQPRTADEKISALEARQERMVQMMDNLFAILKDIRSTVHAESDRRVAEAVNNPADSKQITIPEGMVLNGKTKGLSYFLQVRDGAFYVGNTRYATLSAAAESVSGVRRSGLKFWKLDDGRTVKEVFKRG